jgi:ABC-type lipoprotein export system ATPase subunit
MKELGRENRCTIVMATHDADVIRQAIPVFQLQDGRIVATDD